MRLLSEHPMSHMVSPMITENGELTTNPEEKLQIFLKYYKVLYQSNSGGAGKIALLNSIYIGKLTQEHKFELEALIEIEEIKEAIAGLRWNTSPGVPRSDS